MLGRSLSCPPPEPFLKDPIALRVSSLPTIKSIEGCSKTGIDVSLCGGGCFDSSFFFVSSLAGSIVSFEETTLTAPFQSYAPIFAETVFPSDGSGRDLVDFWALIWAFLLLKLSIWLLITVAILFFFLPPLLGCPKQILANSTSCFHASESLSLVTLLRTLVKALAAWILDAFGIFLTTEHLVNLNSHGAGEVPWLASDELGPRLESHFVQSPSYQLFA